MGTEPGFWLRLHRWGARRPKWYYVAPASFWAVFIYAASLAPPSVMGQLPSGNDKAGHFILYAILALLIVRGWHREKIPPIDLHGFVWLLAFLFGFTVEMFQGLSTYRSFELYDLLANAIGALGGLVLWHLMMMRWGKRTRLYPGLFRPNLKKPRGNKDR